MRVAAGELDAQPDVRAASDLIADARIVQIAQSAQADQQSSALLAGR